MPLDYFPQATEICPTYSADTQWQPIVDGVAYFTELDWQLAGLGPGDAVFVAGLNVDPAIDLAGRAPGSPGYFALGDRLAQLAANGVDVRVLIAGRVLAASTPTTLLGDWRGNVRRAEFLRHWPGSGGAHPPLAGRVLVDFGGSLMGSNHQKAVCVVRAGMVTAFVGGIDLEISRYDAAPHARMRHRGRPWGWHDCAVRLTGVGAERVWRVLVRRWAEASTLPPRQWLRRASTRPEPINPRPIAPAPAPIPDQQPVEAPDTEVRVLWSAPPRKVDSLLPFRRVPWAHLPAGGLQEVYGTLAAAIGTARRYVYLEDQYLSEFAGGVRAYELYPLLSAAARRGVRIILVGSGTRDPDDPGYTRRSINRTVNRDLRTKVLERLTPAHRRNVAIYRIEDVTVHAKLVLIDDAFACIGSANMFSRSMAGVDNELSSAVQTSTSLVRDLRVQVWAEHLRTAVTDELRPALEDLDTALGIFDAAWLPAGSPATLWRTAQCPAGFAPAERALARVD